MFTEVQDIRNENVILKEKLLIEEDKFEILKQKSLL